ncbi:MAG TPA: membrane protein insertase YidC [Actinomycetota bacterium]|nr:membrane protein insertase YidC [Actinomycetota bacterium]
MFESLLHGMGQLLAYFYSLIPNYGVAIIMLTMLVRTAMIPLAIKQAHSMQANRGNAEKMRKLQPEVKKLKEKYKDDRQRQYEEQKKLYEEHGVNMLGGLGGCLPMLLQMPIFFAMYSVLQGCNQIIGARDCVPGYHIPKDSPLYTSIVEQTDMFLGTNLEFSPGRVFSESGTVAVLPYVVLIAVMAGTMWWQTSMMMKAQPAPDPQFAATQKIMKFMPLMLVVFSWNFPAGLILYWSASNTWTIGQQFILMKKYGPLAPEPEKAGRSGGRAAAAIAGDDAPAPRSTGSSQANKRPASKPKQTPSGGARAGQKNSGSSRQAAGKGSPGPGRRPAAKQARPAAKPSGASSKGGANGQKAKGSSAPAGANGEGAASHKPTAARPKGSGARKGNKGGRK